MGSDRAMERVSFSTGIEWKQSDGNQFIEIWRTSSEDGHRNKSVLWSGVPDENNYALIQLIGGAVPAKPPYVPTKRERVADVVREHFWGLVQDYGWSEDDLDQTIDDIMEAAEDD